MSEVRFTSWNAEWMNEFFEGDPPVFKSDDSKGYMTKKRLGDRRQDVTGIINEVDSDIWVILEGPNQASELQLFFDQADVNGDWTCVVQPSGAQSIGIAVRTDSGKFADPAFSWVDIGSSAETSLLKTATNSFEMDTDGDDVKEVHKFERKPLFCNIRFSDGKQMHVLGVHLKSKGIFDTLEWTRWWAKADGNRKRLVAQCFQLRRKFLDKYLTETPTKDIPLIVCGDINDGPGFDTSEMRIQSSGVETLMGNVWKPDLVLTNAMFETLSAKDQDNLDFSSLYTASFADPIFNGVYQRSWIDHILYSHYLKGWIKSAEIKSADANGTPFYRKFRDGSDHSPVTCVIDTALI